jgi:GH18 family chitinase
MRKSLFKLTFLLLILSSFQTKANDNRVFGFLGDWHGNYYYNSPTGNQYEYMTDVVFAFILPQPDGSFAFDINESTWYSRLTNLVTNAHNKGVKAHVSAGGWGSSSGQTGAGDPIHDMVIDPAKRAIFVANIMDLIKTYNLDGFNMDWEYPATSDNYELKKLLLELKQGINNLKMELRRDIELSIAVAGGSFGSEAYTAQVISVADFVMVMAFDNQSQNHSTVSFAKTAMDFWLNSKGMKPEQLILAIPFYSKGINTNYGSYAQFSNGDPAGFYNDDDGSFNGYEYNSRPVIEEKLTEMKNRGGSGVFVWEITEDRTDQYSLLKVLYGNLVSSQDIPNKLTQISVFPNPASKVLNFNLTESSLLSEGLNFKISDITGKVVKKGNLTQVDNKISIELINNAGVYFVTVLNNANESASFKLIKK